jgi:hypothetical protein
MGSHHQKLAPAFTLPPGQKSQFCFCASGKFLLFAWSRVESLSKLPFGPVAVTAIAARAAGSTRNALLADERPELHSLKR